MLEDALAGAPVPIRMLGYAGILAFSLVFYALLVNPVAGWAKALPGGRDSWVAPLFGTLVLLATVFLSFALGALVVWLLSIGLDMLLPRRPYPDER